MTQTFTSAFDLTAEKFEKLKHSLFYNAEPSNNTIQNILNYSKNLEVKTSALIDHIEIIKS